MNVVHIITRLIIGGAQENTLLTCEGLHQRGHRVTLICGTETGPEGSLWPQAEAGGYELVRLSSMIRAIRPFTDWRCLSDLKKILRRLRPDVVHTHSSKAGILGRKAAAAVRTPRIVHTIHGVSFNRTQPVYVQRVYQHLERNAARHTHVLITVADAMIDQSVQAGIAPREQFITIRSGMQVDQFGPDEEVRRRLRKEWSIRENEVVIGTVARLFRNKGYERILQAMPKMIRGCDHLRFIWVGDGAQREQYLAALERMGLRDRVHLTGLVKPERIPELLRGFDLLVHASDWEGLPRAVVQALLTAVPVVCFDNDGAPEVVKSGVTGELVPFGDSARLAEAVIRLARDPEARRRMGSQGDELCRRLFDHRLMVEQIDALYQRLRPT